MALIKCEDCGSDISDQAKACPRCGKTQTRKSTKIFVAILLVVFLIPLFIYLINQGLTQSVQRSVKTDGFRLEDSKSETRGFSLTSFRMVWKRGVIIGLLVPSKTTEAQLKDLIYTIRKARKDGKLYNVLPATTPGLSDKNSIMIVYVFSNPQWAASRKYDEFERSESGSKIERDYLNHIVASYDITIGGTDRGSLGIKDSGFKNKYFEKLF